MDVFSGMFATAWADGFDVRVNSDVDETQTRVSVVTGSMFTVLGLRPQVGRLLDGGDHVTDGAHPVIVISLRTGRADLCVGAVLGRALSVLARALRVE